MSDNIDDFLNRLKSPSLKAVSEIANFLSDRRNQDVDTVTHQFLESGLYPRNLTSFAHRAQDIIAGNIRGNILDDKDPDAIPFSRRKLCEMAQERGIPIRNDLKKASLNFRNNITLGKILELKGLSVEERVKKCFEWVNCLTEFYYDEPLIGSSKRNQGMNNSLNQNQNNEGGKISLEDVQTKQEKEEMIYNLWIQGYLQCDFTK